ncbi:uncharacterized protein LOC141616872 [Silene latifolia]|uniref:uncharacterized protein LOC141616872 n=1 Tax=Silene latifolia TaxID=37657 RepID=UPI003D77B9C4
MDLIISDATLNVSITSHRIPTPLPLLDPDGFSDVQHIRNYYPFFLVGSKTCGDSLRLKCDASWHPNREASAGWFFQNGCGSATHYGLARFWAQSPLHAEAVALRNAISDATSHGFKHVDASSDCLSLVLQVCGLLDPDLEAKIAISSIFSLLSSFHCFSLSYCPRSLNRIAQNIAKSAFM